MVARDPVVDLGHHPVPVIERVEGDNWSDDEQTANIDQRLAGAPD